MPADSHIRMHMADDDPDDRLMMQEALEAVCPGHAIDFSVDGQDLPDDLKRRGPYTHLHDAPLPGVILLDLHMPRLDGHAALRAIKSAPELRRILVVLLTTSAAADDIVRSYDLGVNAFMVKPMRFDQLVADIRTFTEDWFSIVHLP